MCSWVWFIDCSHSPSPKILIPVIKRVVKAAMVLWGSIFDSKLWVVLNR